MGRKVEACAQCTQQCLSLHHGNTKNSSPVVVSFFKVMIGDFSRVLYLPPKFGPTASNLVHKRAILEDSNRRKWEVTVSTVNGSFAFLEGWNAFSLEHGLKVGNFLVFNYINGSHFDVQIFDDSAFEKLDFPKNRSQKKKCRFKNDSATKGGKLHRKDSNILVVSEKDMEIMPNLHKEDIVVVEGTQNNIEKTSEYDNCKRGEQDFGDREREDRGPLTSDDISLEILNKSKDDVCHPDDECHVSQVEAMVCNKDSVLDGKMGKLSPPGTSEFEFTVRNNGTEVRDKGGIVSDRHPCGDKSSDHIVIASTTQPREKKENNFMMPIREVPNCQLAKGEHGSDEAAISKKRRNSCIGSSQNTEKKFNAIPESLNAPISHGEMELVDMASGVYIDKDRLQASGSSKVIERERSQSSCVETKGHGEILRTVKAEPTDYGNSSQITAISCVVPNDDHSDWFLELPTYLPSTKRRRLNMERTVVYLKDNLKRRWPVLYFQHYNLKLFGDGWPAFKTVNNIKPGDECILGVENESDHIYTVDIIRK